MRLLNEIVGGPLTIGIPTNGNIDALKLCLSSLVGLTEPTNAGQGPLFNRVIIRSDAAYPGFNDYYLEQAVDLLRQVKKAEVHFVVVPGSGLREAIDWFMQLKEYDTIFIAADDVYFQTNSLTNNLIWAGQELPDNWGYVCGNKIDLNNRRGWPDFEQPRRAAYPYCPTYGRYTSHSDLQPNLLLDNSFCLFNTKVIRACKLFEARFPVGTHCGGDDTLFGLTIANAGLTGWFAPNCTGLHLEKPIQRFSEPVARVEAVLRQAQLLNIDPKLIDKYMESFMPYVKRYDRRKKE